MTSPYHEDAPAPEPEPRPAPPSSPAPAASSPPAGKTGAGRPFAAIPLLDFPQPPRLFWPRLDEERRHQHPRPSGAGATIHHLPRTAVGRPPRPRDLDAVPAAARIIDFEEEARQRVLRELLLLGQVCPLCMLRRLIERYPRFFMGAPGPDVPPSACEGTGRGQEGRS